MTKEVLTICGGIAAGIIIAIVIERIVHKSQKEKTMDPAKILEECFGKPVYSSTFSMEEVRSWIKERMEYLNKGSKAAVIKANEESLRSVGKDLPIGNDDSNSLILAIFNMSTKEIEDSVLIKYEMLEHTLEQALERGNGVMVVEA